MASFASQIAGHVQRAVFKAKANSCRSAVATATALSSRKAVPGVRVLPRPQAVGIHAAAAVVLAASAEDTVELQIKVDGMVCDGCSSRVLEALQKVPGVKKVDVDLDKGLATIEVEAASQTDALNAMPKLIDTVKDLGFEAEPHFDS